MLYRYWFKLHRVDILVIFEHHNNIFYESTLIIGESDVIPYLNSLTGSTALI